MDIIKFAKSAANTVIFQAKKHAPEILLGAGVAGLIGTAVLASKETLKAQDILKNHEEGREVIAKASALPKEEYSDEDRKKDKIQLYVTTGKYLIKTYWPSVTLGIASVACILTSYGIMKGRNAALLAAYNAVNKAYESYRDRVRNEIGEEQEADIYAERRNEKIESVKTNADGKEVKSKEKIKVFTDGNGHSIYSVFFDESNPFWVKDPIMNKNTVLDIQRRLNDRLGARGWVSLLEAYEALGIDIEADDPRLKEMQLLGWRTKKYGGKGYIDFGIFDGYKQEKIDFVNGRERSILLDMNIDGYIFDDFMTEMRIKA